jgi:hypothetical protein
MATCNRSWAAGVRLCITRLASLVIALAACQTARGGVTPTFNPSTAVSYFNASHFSGGPGGTTNTVNNNAIAAGSPTLTYNNAGLPFTGGSSTGNAGMGESSGPTTSTLSFASGMGVSQTGTGATAASSLTVNFTAIWNIVGGSFGPPLNGSFCVPIAEHIGATGSGSFSCDVHWDAVISGVTHNDIRTPYLLDTQFYSKGTNALFSYSAPAAPFSMPLLAAGDEFEMTGTLSFTALEDETSAVYIPDAAEIQSFGQDPTSFDYTPDIETDNTPEPASLSLILVGSSLLLGGRRRNKAS